MGGKMIGTGLLLSMGAAGGSDSGRLNGLPLLIVVLICAALILGGVAIASIEEQNKPGRRRL